MFTLFNNIIYLLLIHNHFPKDNISAPVFFQAQLSFSIEEALLKLGMRVAYIDHKSRPLVMIII